MEDGNKLLREYHYDGFFWTGRAFASFWNEDLRFWLHTYEKEPTPRQLRIVRQMLEYTCDLRAAFEKSVYEYYQAEVYGAADYGSPEADEEYAPRLTESSQIWRLIPGAEVWISDLYQSEEAVEFKLTFACTWDEEHGFGVKYQDWRIIRFGGASD